MIAPRSGLSTRTKARFVAPVAVAVAVAVALATVIAPRALEPEILLARTPGVGLTPERAKLFRGFLRGEPDTAGRFFDEVPGALALYRGWVRGHGEGSLNVLDREIVRAALKPESGERIGSSGIFLTETFDARDYELLRTSHGWMDSGGTKPVDGLLSVDFARAKREILAHPPHANALLALLHWGVPASEVRAAVPRLTGFNGMAEDQAIEMRAFRSRLLLEDQSLEDPMRAIRAAGLALPPAPVGRPVEPWRPTKPGRIYPLSPRAPLVRRNLYAMADRLRNDPSDSAALTFFRRAARTPSREWRLGAASVLAEAGDRATLDGLRGELASSNGGRVRAALDVCGSPPTAPLLAGLARHPWLWVRLEAAQRLAWFGPLGEPGLALFRRDRARDVRRIARGLPPYGVVTDSTYGTLRQLPDREGPYDPKSPTYWTRYYPSLGPRR